MGRIEPREFVLKDGRKAIIRSPEINDAKQILKQTISILKEAKYIVSTFVDDKEHYTIDKVKERIKSSIEKPGNLAIIAEIDKQIIANANLWSGERKRIQHVAMAVITVHKDFRELGIGTAMMERIIQWAVEHSVIEKIGLGVFSDNKRAINLYRKLGFIEEGRKVKEIKIAQGKYVDSILMYKFV